MYGTERTGADTTPSPYRRFTSLQQVLAAAWGLTGGAPPPPADIHCRRDSHEASVRAGLLGGTIEGHQDGVVGECKDEHLILCPEPPVLGHRAGLSSGAVGNTLATSPRNPRLARLMARCCWTP